MYILGLRRSDKAKAHVYLRKMPGHAGNRDGQGGFTFTAAPDALI
jgi:hypothetical protein